MEKKRYYVIDYIRAFLIINMVLYHSLWDIVYMFNNNISWYTSDLGEIWQRFICITFIMLSGFCWSLSKNHFKRGLIVFIGGIIISAITIIAMPENAIKFGILTFIGFSIFIMIPFEKVLRHINIYIGFTVSILLFIFTKDINKGYIFFYNIKLPRFLYNGDIMSFFGFKDKEFFSTDYFSLLPWFFIFITGYFIYKIMESKDFLYILEGKKNSITEFLSKGSLIIYLIHQPIVYGVLMIIY